MRMYGYADIIHLRKFQFIIYEVQGCVKWWVHLGKYNYVTMRWNENAVWGCMMEINFIQWMKIARYQVLPLSFSYISLFYPNFRLSSSHYNNSRKLKKLKWFEYFHYFFSNNVDLILMNYDVWINYEMNK